MFSASFYTPIYMLSVTILCIVMTGRYVNYSDQQILYPEKKSSMFGLLVPLGYILLVGFRPLNSRYFVDMVNYNEAYYAFYYGSDFNWVWDTQNFIYDNLFAWLGSKFFEIRVFFVTCAVIYFGAVYIAMRKLFESNSLYAFLCFLGAFSTYSYATNGLKAGVAASLFIMALAFIRKPVIMFLLLWLSLGFHHSMKLPIIALVCSLIYRNPRVYLSFWVLCFLISLAHINFFQNLLAGFGEENNDYLLSVDDDWGGKSGFRIDFVLYSVVPIITGFIWYVKNQINDKTFAIIYNTYILTNAVWMLCMYAAFTNRIAYLSWFLYPVVLIYPLFKMDLYSQQGKVVNIAIWGQFLFTLALYYVY